MTQDNKVPTRRRLSAALILSLALLVGGLGILAAVVHFTMPRGGQLASSSSSIGGAFSLVDQSGKPFTEQDLTGKPSLVFFGSTHCPDICPTKLFEITQMLDSLGTDAGKVNVVFITVDPERDTQAVLQRYLALFNPEFVGLTGSDLELRRVTNAFQVVATRRELSSAAGYAIDHSAFTYVVDKRGMLRELLTFGAPVDDIVNDLRIMLDE